MKVLKKVLIISIILVIVAGIIGLAVIPPLIMGDMINHHVDFKIYDSEDYGIKSKDITLTTEDNLNITSYMTEAEKPKGTIIILSGIHNPSVTAFFGYAKMFADNGYSSLLIEMRGHGESDGDIICLGMKEWLDVKAGVDYLKNDELYKDLPIIVMGTSMGASTAINSIGEIDEIDALISLSAYSSWADIFIESMENQTPKFVARMERPFIYLYSGFKYGFKYASITPKREIKKLNGRPALLMHSTQDSQVLYENFQRLLSETSEEDDIFIYTREGDEHFICYEKYFENPVEDEKFSEAILYFLEANFE